MLFSSHACIPACKYRRECFSGPSTRFETKTELLCSAFKKVCVHTYRFHILFFPSTLQSRSREKPHGSVCPTFWILTVQSSGARSWLFWWRHRFQIASFSPSTLENSVFKKHRFQIAPLWRAFSNGSDFGDRFRRLTVDDGRIRSKTPPFALENEFVWTGPQPTGLRKPAIKLVM